MEIFGNKTPIPHEGANAVSGLFVLSLLLRSSFLSQILFERKTRKTSLQRIDHRVIARLKHQTATVFLKYKRSRPPLTHNAFSIWRESQSVPWN